MADASSSRLLALPYDIRYLIYQQLFPASRHIYIQAGSNSLMAINDRATGAISTAVLRTSRAFNLEFGQFLYSNYLFHIVGQKKDCLANYEALEKTLRKYGNSAVHVHPLSNGPHSQTGAILLHVGDARLASVKGRGRGVPMSIDEMRQEVESLGIAGGVRGPRRRHNWQTAALWHSNWARLIGITFAVAVALLAILITWRSQIQLR